MPLSDIDIEDILNAYAAGMFPMADDALDKDVYWVDPEIRGQLSIKELHIPRRLRATIKQFPFEVTHDQDFEQVIDLCGAYATDRPTTWINQDIKGLFIKLHEIGLAHSVECWETDKKTQQRTLVGGVYGLSLGGAFCAESKFHRATNASKIVLVHLCARLWKGGYSILDIQFINEHLKQFGAYEIPKDTYLTQLHSALSTQTDFHIKNYTEQSLITEYLDFNRP